MNKRAGLPLAGRCIIESGAYGRSVEHSRPNSRYRDLLRPRVMNVAMHLNWTDRTTGFGTRGSTYVLHASRPGWDPQRVALSCLRLAEIEPAFRGLEPRVGTSRPARCAQQRLK